MINFKQFITENEVTWNADKIAKEHLYIKDGQKYTNGGVDLYKMGITELPDLSDTIVTEDFICASNNLLSLKGSPMQVNGKYFCYNNHKLTSLEGCPKYIGGDFDCCATAIESLDGAPDYIGGEFQCDNITDAEYKRWNAVRRMKKSLDPETEDLFSGMIDTL